MGSREERRKAARERLEERMSSEGANASSEVDRARNKFVAAAFCVFAGLMLIIMAVTPSQLEKRAGQSSDALTQSSQASSLFSESGEDASSSDGFDPASSTIPTYVDASVSEALVSAAYDDPDAAYIVEHASEYESAFSREEQVKLLELAAEEPSSREFVKSALESYPSDAEGDLGSEPSQNGFPLLMQWDPRWALVEYSSAPMGLSGCAPTTLSMLYSGLTGKTDMTPADMAELSRELGCMDETEGTYAELFEQAAPILGLDVRRIPVDRRTLLDALESGACVVCNVGAGDFTDGGHFLLIVGVEEDGSLRINDPFSESNSSVSWDVDRILGQTMGLYAARSAS